MSTNKLHPTDPAIDFTYQDYQGNTVALNNFRGRKVLLAFFRVASCPFCNLRVRELIKNHGELERKGISVIAFFASTAEEIAQYAGEQHPPFPIVPDPQLDLYRKYGIESAYSGMFKVMVKPLQMLRVMTSGFFNLKSISDHPLIPADFLIQEDHTIYRAYYGKDFGDHLPLEDILNWK